MSEIVVGCIIIGVVILANSVINNFYMRKLIKELVADYAKMINRLVDD